MNPESLRIADQLRRAFTGEPWHGPPVKDLLAGVTAAQAAIRPISGAHTIHELVIHIDVWLRAALDAARGVPMPKLYGTEKDWPAAGDDEAEWAHAKTRLFQGGEEFAQVIENFPDARLQQIVPGRQYDFYYLFHGIVQHSLYHGGQIAMLGKARGSSAS